MMRFFTIFILSLIAFSRLSAATTATTTTDTIADSAIAINSNVTSKTCGGIHIRNDLKSFQQLQGCTIIKGPLTIALVSNINNPKDYDNITFPLLSEVTDYLLFFRVHNLTTLSKLFPNLRVIRGRALVSNYALIIYEMMHLQRIDLPNLRHIIRGGVRIEGNPNLCYASTVNWDGICGANLKGKFAPHFIKDNNMNCDDRCPDHCQPWPPIKDTYNERSPVEGDVSELGARNNRSLFCWNSQDCHESCSANSFLIRAPDGGCCSEECGGGCHMKDRDDQCIACINVSEKGRCVKSCGDGLYEYEGRCLTQKECETWPEDNFPINQCSRTRRRKLKAVTVDKNRKVCQENCPTGQEEDPSNGHSCKSCDKDKCRKVCTPQDQNKLYMVTNVNSMKELSGCNVINGSLEISIKGGRNVLNILETTFRDLEEISGYLKITRSYPILTLDFLRGLKFINGTSLDRTQYSLVIIDNPNLQDLFVYKDKEAGKQLAILGGKIFVHLNPKLCPNKINHLKQYATVADWDEQDVSIHNNGDKEACNTAKLGVNLGIIGAHYAIISFENFAAKLDDPRSLLFYLINYREAPENTNITMFDGRDGCNSLNDVWIQVEEVPAKQTKNGTFEWQTAIIDVKPATHYALYVKTFTIMAGSTGAISDMIYFDTAPDTPGIPRELESEASSHDTVIISWLSPSRPNGMIEHYNLTIKNTPEFEELERIDVCGSINGRDTITRKISHNEPKQPHFAPPKETTNTSSCIKELSNLQDLKELQEGKVSFQDTVIDIVYLKNTCSAPIPDPPHKDIKKRSIEHNVEKSDKEISSLTKSNDSLRFTFNKAIYKTEKRVNVSDLTYEKEQRIKVEINGLEHFKLYEIEVLACHGSFKQKATVSRTYNNCSLSAVAQVRTKAIPEYDLVDSSTIRFHPANQTNGDFITWDKPLNPNGLILAFRIRYKLKNTNIDVWNEVCINSTAYDRDHGLILSNIGPGVYELKVQTISMYTESGRLWSRSIEFEILQATMLSPLLWTLIFITTFILLALGVAFGAYYTQKKTRDDLIYASVNPDYVQYNPDEWEVDKSKLIVEAQIGTGSFGTVYKGQLITEKGMRDCAVKTVPPTSTAKQRFDFLREASIMKQFDTFHVVKLLGVVSVTTPVYVIMEYMENGDLKDFLRKQREAHQKQGKFLVDGIYLMAAQIADGMAYLASKKFVHRDLAARNCMVGENRVVKVGDFGLTRDIYANDYYRRDTQGRLPVRWMAPESLLDNICTSASDAWSYGIVLWEIVTFSASPYHGLSNDEVINRVIQGYTMPRPEHCPDKLFNIMERCWRKNDKDRPTFLDIVEYLLPETEGKLYPNCYYRKPKVEGDSIAQTIQGDSNTGTESYPLLSWPSSNRANGLTNGDNHIMNHNHSFDHSGK